MITPALIAQGTAIRSAKPVHCGETGISRQRPEAEGSPDPAGDFLTAAFLPDDATLASFLVNALYLFGDNSLIAHGGASPGVTAELTRQGHQLAAAGPCGGNVPGREKIQGRERSPIREGRYDRALLLAEPLGRGSDAEILDRLRALRRSVRPGGLVCFHIFDRDRAWFLAAQDAWARGRNAVSGLHFDPANGRIYAAARAERGSQIPGQGEGAGRVVVKTWNRSELHALLRCVGLKLERVYGDWDGTGPDMGASGRLIVVAAKPRRARVGVRRRTV